MGTAVFVPFQNSLFPQAAPGSPAGKSLSPLPPLGASTAPFQLSLFGFTQVVSNSVPPDSASLASQEGDLSGRQVKLTLYDRAFEKLAHILDQGSFDLESFGQAIAEAAHHNITLRKFSAAQQQSYHEKLLQMLRQTAGQIDSSPSSGAYIEFFRQHVQSLQHFCVTSARAGFHEWLKNEAELGRIAGYSLDQISHLTHLAAKLRVYSSDWFSGVAQRLLAEHLEIGAAAPETQDAFYLASSSFLKTHANLAPNLKLLSLFEDLFERSRTGILGMKNEQKRGTAVSSLLEAFAMLKDAAKDELSGLLLDPETKALRSEVFELVSNLPKSDARGVDVCRYLGLLDRSEPISPPQRLRRNKIVDRAPQEMELHLRNDPLTRDLFGGEDGWKIAREALIPECPSIVCDMLFKREGSPPVIVEFDGAEYHKVYCDDAKRGQRRYDSLNRKMLEQYGYQVLRLPLVDDHHKGAVVERLAAIHKTLIAAQSGRAGRSARRALRYRAA